jgi:hypothetical protein
MRMDVKHSPSMYTKKMAGRTFRAKESSPFVFDNNLNPIVIIPCS